jgi:hypothetical protein
MFLTWLEAETDPITAAPAAAIVTALILTSSFVFQCFSGIIVLRARRISEASMGWLSKRMPAKRVAR